MSYNCSGESMENALRACCKGIKIGKILIHRVGDNGQQVSIEILYYCDVIS
jgi:uridine kinase